MFGLREDSYNELESVSLVYMAAEREKPILFSFFFFFCNLQLRQEKKDLSNLELTEKETNILE